MLLIWDYFGVIAQDAFWYTSALLAMDKNREKRMYAMHKKADLGQISWDDYCVEVAKDIGLPLEEVRERYQHHNINPGVISAIRGLKGVHQQVLMSNASHQYLLPIMEKLGIGSLFDEVFISSQMGFAKPDPKAFLHVLKAMNYDAKNCILIDDSRSNTESAKSLAMRAVLYTPGCDVLKDISEMSKN